MYPGFGKVYTFMSWQSIPHSIIYTFFVQFKIFFSEQYFTKTALHSISMSHIVYFPNISSNNLLCSFSTITLATLWIKSSLEQLWKEVGQLLFSSLEKMGMDWNGVDHCDMSTYVWKGSCLYSLLDCHGSVQKCL